MTYVFDACTVFRYLDGESGSDRVEAILLEAAAKRASLVISAIQWGEVIQIVLRRGGLIRFSKQYRRIQGLALTVEPATENRAERAAHIKFQLGLPNADCFAVELASDSPDHILVTSDFDMKRAEQDIQIEFLPTKQWPPLP